MQIPHRVGRGYPAVAEIFRVAVAMERLKAVAVGTVDLGDVVRAEQVVRVEDQKRIVLLQSVAAPDPVEQIVQRVALSDPAAVEAPVDARTVGLRSLRRAVGAVIGHDIGRDAFGGIILCADALQEVWQNRFLIARRDQNGVARRLLRLVLRLAPEQRNDQIHRLIEKAQPCQEQQRRADMLQKLDHMHGHSPAFVRMLPYHTAKPMKKQSVKFLRFALSVNFLLNSKKPLQFQRAMRYNKLKNISYSEYGAFRADPFNKQVLSWFMSFLRSVLCSPG